MIMYELRVLAQTAVGDLLIGVASNGGYRPIVKPSQTMLFLQWAQQARLPGLQHSTAEHFNY